MDRATVSLSHILTVYTLLCPPKPPGLGLYPSIPEPRRRVVVVHVPQTLSTIKYDCYRNIPRSISMGGFAPQTLLGLD